MRVNLAYQKHLIAPTHDRFADEFFRAPLSIHFGSVNQCSPEVEPKPKRGDHFLACSLVLSDHPSAQAKSRHELARWKCDCLHVGSLTTCKSRMASTSSRAWGWDSKIPHPKDH